MKLGSLDADDFKLGDQQVDAIYLGSEEVWTNIIDIELPQFSGNTVIGDWLDDNYPGVEKVRLINNLTQPRFNFDNLRGRYVEFVNNGEVQGTNAGVTAINIADPILLINNGWIRGAGGNGGTGGNGGQGGQGATINTSSGSVERNHENNYNWVCPPGVQSVFLCMIGGGGGGSTGGGGGRRGQIVTNQNLAVVPGQTYTAICGAGGAGSNLGANQAGNAGSQSSFGSTTASGGAGGTATTRVYAGNGAEAPNNCYGTFTHGRARLESSAWWYGGEAGFANGGDTSVNFAGTRDGSKGSGGGSSSGHVNWNPSGAGGRGVVRWSWDAVTVTGGAGGAGGNTAGAGGTGQSFNTARTDGSAGGAGSAGSPSSPPGGNAGGTGGARGTGGAGGAWGVNGSQGATGATGSQGAGGGSAGQAGSAGSAGQDAGNAIQGSSLLLEGSITGNVNGDIVA